MFRKVVICLVLGVVALATMTGCSEMNHSEDVENNGGENIITERIITENIIVEDGDNEEIIKDRIISNVLNKDASKEWKQEWIMNRYPREYDEIAWDTIE